MTDIFAKTLLETIEKLSARIAEAEQRILSDQQLIDECSHERQTYQSLLHAYLEKKKADAEALATLYTSNKTHADFATFSAATGTELPADVVQWVDAPELEAEADADD